jgi:hypothetical protein
MISVGLDIQRLGLMVITGQPKTTAEYIQATSRVGRNVEWPGLVVTLFNIHKPRDRSHYERFAAYHESFYRAVEATSVTPFSARALDRGLAAVAVALARLGHGSMAPSRAAVNILTQLGALGDVADALGERAEEHGPIDPASAKTLRQAVEARTKALLDDWYKIAAGLQNVGTPLQYGTEERSPQPLLRDFLDPDLNGPSDRRWKFRAGRSLRDVEPNVNLWMSRLTEDEGGEDDA